MSKFDEVEVSLDSNGYFRYREVRWEGDPTARWINRDRAKRLVGTYRVCELEMLAHLDAIEKFYGDEPEMPEPPPTYLDGEMHG